MKVVPVRRYVVKGTPKNMAVLDGEQPKAVVVLARRDLIFLQRLFRKMKHRSDFQRRITDALTEITDYQREPT